MNQKVTPVITYLNLSVNKSHIYIYNKKKSGIYRWTNLIDGKSYVGSSIKLNRRLSDYFCIDRFKRIRIKGRSRINEAILKYGISTFSLDILEYCESNVIIERGQYYLDLLKPEYNIRKIANSPLGRKMPEEAKINISIKNKGVNDPVQG